MPQIELWSSLVSAIDPANSKAMPAVLQSTIDLLESELVKARAALREIQPTVSPMLLCKDELATGAMDAYRQHLIGRAPDFYYGTRRLTPKEIGLVPTVREIQSDDDDESVEEQPTVTVIPPPLTPLEELLNNSLVLDQMAPYLPASSLMALASTSRSLRSIITETPYVFRHLDLTQCRGAKLPRNTQADDSMTEDEFYAAPLQRIFGSLERRSILQDVRTLVLDGLSVPADLISEIVLSDRFNVSILSIRECQHLNERKLMQVLQHAVRPTRPEGTPRVKAIYHFTPRNRPQTPVRSNVHDWWASQRSSRRSSRSSSPAPAESAAKNQETSEQNMWYKASGKVLKNTIEEGWAQTIQKCQGIIAFDAALCRGPRHNVDLFTSANEGHQPQGRLLGPALATVALGPKGCEGCHSIPEGPSIWGQSPKEEFPLLTPIPLHTSSAMAAIRPTPFPDEHPSLIARCTDCLADRWCHRCNKWICADCLPQPERVPANLSPHQTAIPEPNPNGQEQGRRFAVSKDCWECGPTCASCKTECQRACQSCQGVYCIDHNDGCSARMCDWCNASARHRMRAF